MNNINSKELILKYTMGGLILGLFFPILALIIDFSITDISFSFSGIAQIIKENPIHWIIGSAPFIIVFFAYLTGKTLIKNAEQSKKSLKSELQKSKKILNFVQKLINNEIDAEYELQGNNDELGKSIVNLRDNLKKNKEKDILRRKEDEQHNWISEGLAKFGEILRSDNNNMEELSYNIISNFLKYLDANQGGFFILNDNNKDDKHFELTACYAYDRKKFCDKRIEWGEGLTGTCALEKQTIHITEIPDSYINITSGLGKANPRSLLIIPLIFNDELYGIIEMASFKKFEKFEIEFVEKVAESIASTISTVKINLRTAQLLKESQEQAEALAAQEEEMRQNMEELQVTQEEAARQAEKFSSFTNSVNHTLIRAEYYTDGTLLYANTKFLNKLGYSGISEIEGKHISIFINKKDKEWFFKIWDGLAKGGKHFEGDMKHVTKQGQDLWTMANYTCVRKDDGSVEKILFLAIDTTEQKKQSLDYQGQIDALNRSSLKAEFAPNGEILNCNDLFIETMGYTMDEINNKSVFDFIDIIELQNFKKIWERVTKGVPFQGQVKNLTKSDEEKWFRGTYTAVNDMYGDVAKIIYIANEITKEKLMEIETGKQTEQLKIQEEKLRLSGMELSKKLEKAKEEMKLQFKETEKIKIRNERTLEGALDAIITINQNGTIEFFNKAAEELWGKQREEVLGKNVKILFSEEAQKEDEFVSSYVEPEKNKIIGQRKEVNIKNKEGEDVPVLFLLSEAKVEDEHTFTAFIQNIEVELF